MDKIILGCDPDSKASGFAYYVNGKLTDLKCMETLDFYLWLKGLLSLGDVDIELHIEDLNANNCSSFNHSKKMSAAAKYKVSEGVGKCKQAQIEIERVAERFNVKIVHHKVSKQWKDSKTGKALLERYTGWNKASNEDTRSSAWFGFIGSR